MRDLAQMNILTIRGFPEAHFWITSCLPTIHELSFFGIGLFRGVGSQRFDYCNVRQ